MYTATTDARSASSYPLRAGAKSESTSRDAAIRVDRDPERKMLAYSRIVIRALLDDKALTIDHIADQIGEHHLYCRPRATELTQFGVLYYGAKRVSPTCGRMAGTLHPSPALIEYIARHDPDEECELEHLVRSFIEARQMAAAKAERINRRGAV